MTDSVRIHVTVVAAAAAAAGIGTLLTEPTKVVINFEKFKLVVVSVVNDNVFFYCLGQTIDVSVRRKVKVRGIF
jgi:hypothetical protein